jgi:GR25 family glycosyltransferase involved in LPS biosynthesis
MTPKIYCINLDRSPDRWRFMREQFEQLGLDYERVPAIDGKVVAAGNSFICPVRSQRSIDSIVNPRLR